MMPTKKIPSLVDLCIQTAIDNVRYIGNVGEMELHLLQEILPHCTAEQLTNIEDSTEGRDLSPVTDVLWKNFYKQAFGAENVESVVRRMEKLDVVFKWRQLYEAKNKEREAAKQKTVEKMRLRYAEDQAKKQSRQVQLTSKLPPSSCKRGFSGGNGYNLSSVKSNLMKKSKLEYLNSREAQIHATIRRNALQRQNYPPQSAPRSTNPNKFITKGSTSSSKISKPFARG